MKKLPLLLQLPQDTSWPLFSPPGAPSLPFLNVQLPKGSPSLRVHLPLEPAWERTRFFSPSSVLDAKEKGWLRQFCRQGLRA